MMVKRLKLEERILYKRENGKKRIVRIIERRMRVEVGVGTTRGAGVMSLEWVRWEVRREEVLVTGRAVVVEEDAVGEEACAARASATGSTVSPSKNLAIAIWTFHWLRRSKGRAAEGCWSVTAVNCWRASRCEGVSWESSASALELELAMMGRYML